MSPTKIGNKTNEFKLEKKLINETQKVFERRIFWRILARLTLIKNAIKLTKSKGGEPAIIKTRRGDEAGAPHGARARDPRGFAPGDIP